MISLPLFKMNMKTIMKIGSIFLVVLAAYDLAIIYMFNPQMTSMLDEFQQLMPEIMSLFGMTGSSSSLISFLNTYLYGMLLLLVPMLFAIILSNKFIMSYVDKGSMANLLATPNSRLKIIFTQMISLIVGMVLLILINVLVLIIGSSVMFPGELDVGMMIELNISLLCLQMAISGITFFAACLFNSPRNFYTLGAGLPIVFYIIQMMANMGGKLEKFKYMTIFTLFRNNAILNGESYFLSTVVLLGIATVLYISGIMIFRKKNLSL